MDMSEVKAFNAELSGLYDNKPPISKAKMSAITRGAIKAIKFYKHVVHSVEKFIQKCKPEYKVPGLYVIDSIVRQSRHQFGQEKDVFAPRFAKNMQQTFANLFRCPPEDKCKIIRVLNLWQKNNVFSVDVIQPLLDMADPNHPLHQEIQQQQNNAANGSTLNISHNTSDKLSPAPALHTPHISTPMGDQDQSSSSGVKFNRKLLNDFEYESEDDTPHSDPAPHPIQPPTTAEALGSILTNPEIMRQLQSLQAQMQMMTGMQMPNLMPMMTDVQLQQNQNPFFGLQQQDVNKNDGKEEVGNNESDIEFVETGPQVIEIPDANDSRSPSPRSRRHRSRSRSPRRRRRSRSRSRSPRRRRDRDRDRDKERERDRDKDKEKSYKEREAEREKQKEREKKGLPPIKKENLSVCSTTLWVGHLSKLATAEELSDLFCALGGVSSIDVVAPRGCAFVVMERRRDAHKALQKLNKHKLHTKEITVAWAPGKGVKGREWKDYWEAELGVSYLPWAALQARWSCGQLSLLALEDGGQVDEDTLPPWLPPRMLPKLDSMMQMAAMPGMPGAMPGAGMPGAGMPGAPMPGAGMPGVGMPGPMPGGMPRGLPPQLMGPMMTRPPMPPPGMTPGMPPMPGMPPGIRPPNMSGVPGLGTDAAGQLLGFPPALPPQSMPQPGMGLFPGVVVRGLPLLPPALLPPAPHAAPAHPAHPAPHAAPAHPAHPAHRPQPQPAHRSTEISGGEDAMDLDTEDSHEEHAEAAPPLLSDQLLSLLSKPPPIFNSLEPPPNFNPSEPPPFSQPPPTEDKQQEDDKKDRDSRDRKDRDRRDRDRDRRERGDRDRDRDRHRDRGGRDRGRDERDDRRDRDRGRDRKDRDRERDRDRFPARDSNNRERSREKSPRNPNAEQNEKSLQERLWEMANGKKPEDKPKEDIQENKEERIERPPLLERPRSEVNDESCDAGMDQQPPEGWNQPPRLPPPGFIPPDMRMRGPPRPPLRGPWMDGPPGPGIGPFGPRFNGMGPPPFNRPPFERPPFDGPMFDGPPRFERPPFNRMPFDGPRPPFDGPRPPFDGPRPPFDGPRPPFDGPRPPFDGPRPPFDGPRPPFDGSRPPFDGSRPPFDGPRPPFDGSRPPFDSARPPFDGPRPPFDGPRQFDDFEDDRQFEGRFDGPPPPEFFDNRRFDDRDQYNDRGWNGEREWDRRNEWDDRRRNRPRDEDRFRDRNDRNERNDRRRNYDDRKPRDDRNPREERNRDDRSQSIDKTNEAPKENIKDDNKNDTNNATKEERASRRDKDRKSRWGAAEQSQNDPELTQEQIDSIISEHSDAQSNIARSEDTQSQIDNVQTENVNEIQESQNKPENIDKKQHTEIIEDKPEYNKPSQIHQQEARHESKEDTKIPERHNDIEMNLENVLTDLHRQESSFDKQDNESSNFEREENKTDYEENPTKYEEKESLPTKESNKDYNEPSYDPCESKKADDFDLPPRIEAPSLYDAGDAIDASFALINEAETSKTIENVPIETMDTSNKDDIFPSEETPSNIENKEGAA